MKLIALVTVALALSTSAFAQTRRTTTSNTYFRGPAAASYNSEITTNLTGGEFFSGKDCKNCDSGSTLVLGAGFLHTLDSNIQIGGEGAFRMLSKTRSGTGDSETLFDIVGVGAWNFTSDFANSIFAKAGIGLYSVLKDDNSGYENKLGFFIGGGKRFQWLNNVSYSPELRLAKKGDIDMGIEIHVLNFSIVW